MKITHFNNSFIGVQKNDTILVCDPWVGTSNYGGWLSYPIMSDGPELLRQIAPTHIYISHIHQDHLDFNMLKNGIDPSTPVYIKNYADGLLCRRLKSLGLENVIELEPWTATKISDDLEISIIPTDATNSDDLEDAIDYDIDTSILIRSLADDTLFYNNVDSPMTTEGFVKVREYAKTQSKTEKIDIACIAVGAASEYPQCFVDIDRSAEKERIIDASLIKLKRQLDILDPEIYFFAGGTYLIPGKYAELNQYIAQPTTKQICQFLEQNGQRTKVVDLEGGGTLEKLEQNWVQDHDSLCPPAPEKSVAIGHNRNRVFDYHQDAPLYESESQLNDLFVRAKEKYFNKLASTSTEIKWSVTFNLYEELQLDSNCKIDKECKPLHQFVLAQDATEPPPYELVCHLDRQLFIGLIQRKYIWNLALSGSVILYERRPNVFLPTIPFSLNYLAA